MSIYKGTQLIAANGAPGLNGANGRDGVDGGGVILKNTCTELHNMVNIDGNINGTNDAPYGASWCTVDGYGCKVGSAGQGSQIRGMYCELSTGQGVQVEGNTVIVSKGDQGAHIEGNHNYVELAGNGVHIEGMSHGYIVYPETITPITIRANGAHLEGFGFHDIPTGINVSDGVHIGGSGLTSSTPVFSMPHQRGNFESGYIRLIGLHKSGDENGILGLALRNDGCMGIAGDLAFTAIDSNGNTITTGPNVDGRYTLGEIVKALIDAGILAPPL